MTTRARGRSLLIGLLLLLAAVLVGAGCGGDNNDNKTSTSKLDTITAGKLKVGSDIPYKPFEFGRSPNYQGFDVDVVTQVAKRLKLTAQFHKTPFDTIFRNLAQ